MLAFENRARHVPLLLMCAVAFVVLQIKGTVLLMPNGSDLVTSAPVQTIQTDKKVRCLRSCYSAFAQVHMDGQCWSGHRDPCLW